MDDQELTSSSMINWISDDIQYLANLPRRAREKENGIYNPLRQAHDARLLIVFGYAMVEGYTVHTAQEVDVAENISTIELIKRLDYPPEFLTVGSVETLSVLLNGILNLRHIIAHGLTAETAKNFAGKVEMIKQAGLPVDPMKLDERHFEFVLKALHNVINILGSGKLIHNRNK